MERAYVPGSSTTPGCPSACVGALGHIAFRYTDSVGTRNQFSIAAQWLACTFPYRRLADILADACARLGPIRYSLIVVDLHHLLLAGLPAHPSKNVFSPPENCTQSAYFCSIETTRAQARATLSLVEAALPAICVETRRPGAIRIFRQARGECIVTRSVCAEACFSWLRHPLLRNRPSR